jgi:drug/metabolite transporter (DMT)-like permease
VRTLLTHLRSLKRTSLFVGVAALLVAAVFVFAMVLDRSHDQRAIVAALAGMILAVGILLPPKISNYCWGLYVLLVAARCVATGSVLRISRQNEPLLFWLATLFLFFAAGVLLQAAYRVRSSPVPRGNND